MAKIEHALSRPTKLLKLSWVPFCVHRNPIPTRRRSVAEDFRNCKGVEWEPPGERKGARMDVDLHYREQGTGEPLILLHGNGEDGSYFERQMDAFASRFRVIALDTRGHGRSPRGEAPFTIRQFADDLLAFMDGQGIERAHLLGFSDGGNIALAFALAHPERVGKLVLNGANLDGGGVKPSVQLPIVAGYGAASLFARWSVRAHRKAEMLSLMVNDPNIAPEELAELRVPTLVVAGTRDMIKEEHTRLIARNIPGARLAFVEGDHFVAAGNPEEFNKVVRRFLES